MSSKLKLLFDELDEKYLAWKTENNTRNSLMILLELYPDNNRWDYGWISINPNITWEIVENHPGRPWDYDNLSRNPNITWEIIKNRPSRPWNYYFISK